MLLHPATGFFMKKGYFDFIEFVRLADPAATYSPAP